MSALLENEGKTMSVFLDSLRTRKRRKNGRGTVGGTVGEGEKTGRPGKKMEEAHEVGEGEET